MKENIHPVNKVAQKDFMLRKGHVSRIYVLMQTFQFDLGFVWCLVQLFVVLRLVMQNNT